MKFIQTTPNNSVSDSLTAYPYPDFVKNVIASRLDSAKEVLEGVLSANEIPDALEEDLPDIKIASSIVRKAIENKKNILCVVDYDADGICSGSILKEGLLALDADVQIFVTNRYEDGYGFSKGVVEKIIEKPLTEWPDLIITADLGSSDGAQIKAIQKEYASFGKKLEFIVTDHHHISETTPPSTADAFVNYTRKDVFHCFDNLVCGAGVAWFLVRAVAKSMYSFYDAFDLIDLVAVATVGDMVSLKDPINRAFVKQGLVMMNNNPDRLAWQLILEENKGNRIDEGTLGFKIVPKINALSRMGDDESTALTWLTSKDPYTAKAAYINMSINNEERKEEQVNCQNLALEQAMVQQKEGVFICVCYTPEYSHGVVGLAASHVVKHTGLPAIVFSKTEKGFITGSCRSIPGFDIRDALAKTQDDCGLLAKFGGHTMAAGLSLDSEDDILLFSETINNIAKSVFDNQQPEPMYYYDGELSNELQTTVAYKQLNFLAPYGQLFERPLFHYEGIVSETSLMGADNQHGKFKMDNGFEFVWFNHNDEINDLIGKKIETVSTLSLNSFRGKEKIQNLLEAYKVLE